MRVFFAVVLCFLPFDAFAVPGPLISGGAGLISAAGALFAIVVGAAAIGFSHVFARLRAAYRNHPGIFTGISFSFFAVVSSVLTWFGYFVPSSDSADRLLEAIRSNPGHAIGSEEFNALPAALDFASGAKSPREAAYPELEKEIAYSVGRNKNVVWSRYLAAGKIRIDEPLLAEIRRGWHLLTLPELLKDLSSPNPSYEIVDLRTSEEFGTSARFAAAKNVEYRQIMDGEAVFDPKKSYVMVCHDGNLDLSRSVLSAIYLRQHGIAAFALDTGMRPILEAFDIAPIAFEKRPRFSVWKKGESLPDGRLVDALGGIGTVSDFPKDAEVREFPFYRMDSATYDASVSETVSALRSGQSVHFACYDGFSCFYSRVFVERFSKLVPENPPGILVFR